VVLRPQGDLGVLHTSRLVRIGDKPECAEQAGGLPHAQAERRRKFLDVDFGEAQRSYDQLLTAVAKELGRYLEPLPQGSLVVEFGSRYGDLAKEVAQRWPHVRVQPTEGAYETLGVFLLLQERVLKHNEEFARLHGEEGPRLLPPRYVAGGPLEAWTRQLKLGSASCVFAANVLQFLPEEALEAILQGCRRALRPAGYVFLCGPFFDNGEVGDASLKCHDGLQSWAKEAAKAYPDRTLAWGLHDLQNIRRCAAALGFDVVEQSMVGLERDWEWSILVLQKQLPRRGRPSGLEVERLTRPTRAFLAKRHSGVVSEA